MIYKFSRIKNQKYFVSADRYKILIYLYLLKALDKIYYFYYASHKCYTIVLSYAALKKQTRYAKQKWRALRYQTWRNLYLASSNFWVSVISHFSSLHFQLMSDSSHGVHIRSLVSSFKFLSRIFTLCCRHGREYIMQFLIYRPSWSHQPLGIEKRVYAEEQMESRWLSLSHLFRISFTSLWHFSENSLRMLRRVAH